MMGDESRVERRNHLATAIWDSNLDDSAEGKLSAYFRWLGREFHGSLHELVFFVNIIRLNMALKRSALSHAVRSLRTGWEGEHKEKTTTDAGFRHPAAASLTDELKDSLDKEHCNIEDRLVDAVRVMFALDLATDHITAGGGQVQSFWDSSQSLNDVIKQKFPEYSPRQDTQMAYKAIAIDQRNFAAKYLEDHAGVKIEWTTHLPDHLLLEDKTLYVFELPCMLEIAYNTRPTTVHEVPNTVRGSTKDAESGQSLTAGKESEEEITKAQKGPRKCDETDISATQSTAPDQHPSGPRAGNSVSNIPIK